MQLFAEGWAYLMANPMSFVYMTGGILMGIIFGCIPGLTAVLGVTLMIPFTYAMSAAEGLSTLIGIYVQHLLSPPGTAIPWSSVASRRLHCLLVCLPP